MIDTGADISILKRSSLNSENQIDTTDKITIRGVTDSETYSVGSVKGQVKIENKDIEQKFQIVDDNFPINTNGILGRDFLIKNNCKIDYENFTLSILIKNDEFILPMLTQLPKSQNIILPARTQTLHPINIKIEEDSIVLNQEIQKGVFIANSIIPAKGIAQIAFLNTLEQDVIINSIEPNVTPLRHFHVIDLKKNYEKNKKVDQYERLLKELNINISDKKAKQSILKICEEYADCFHLDGDTLTVNNFYKQKISMADNNPVYIKNYRLPQAQQNEINEQVDELLKNNIIETSVSPFNSPLLVVPKKDSQGEKKWRLVVDFRQLNKKIIDDKFPLTRLDDVLDTLGRAKYFSTLDLTSSFHQIELDEESRSKTAFSTLRGHFQFKRLPFGLKISTNSFQRMLSVALAGLSTEAFLYVDDIIIFGCSLLHHNDNLTKVFQRLRKYNLKLNPKKCNWLQTEVTYLGHLITNEGIKPDPRKYEAVTKYPTPINAEEVKRFVAFCNYYRRFIQNFASIARPLNALSKKGVEFVWTKECEDAFISLKNKLINPPILKYPNYDETFIVTTDASNTALGAVLSQGDIGKDLPISYASRSLTKHEVNKPIIEKELLGIHWAINYFRPYLYGRKFTVITDHRPLVSLFTHKNPSSKLTRIRLDLADYTFDIIYKQGSMNTNADALSRIKLDSEMLKEMIPTSKINIMTRSKSTKIANEKINKNKIRNAEFTIKDPPIYIWECGSLTEVKNIRKLKFNKVLQKHDVHQRKSSSRLRFDSGEACSRVHVNNKDIIIEYSDNPSLDLGLILEKLIFKMNKENIKQLAIANNDRIFEHISIDEFKKLYNKLQQKVEEDIRLKILIYNPPIRVIDDEEKEKIIENFHNTPHAGGHSGIKRTINKIKQRYCWKNLNKMVKKYVSECITCAQSKQIRNTKERLVLTETPTTSFEVVTADTVGPLRPSNDFRYILTLQCELTKFVEAIPIKSKDANTVAKALVDNFILRHGSFKTLKTDMGTEFINEVMKNVYILFGINHITSTPYHHETLGSIERNHRVLNEYLIAFAKEDNWHEWIPYFVFSYNTTPHSSIGISPFELIYGKLVKLPEDSVHDVTNPVYNIDDYSLELKFRLGQMRIIAKKLLDRSKIERKESIDKIANPLDLEVGDKVYLKVGNKKKLDNPYKGPYEVVELNGVNSKIKINNEIKEVHNNRLKK